MNIQKFLYFISDVNDKNDENEKEEENNLDWKNSIIMVGVSISF